MFEPTGKPRVFALPCGVDFARALVDGLERRMAGLDPLARCTVELFVNTHRMQRRLRALYDERPPSLLPRIRLITDLGSETPLPGPAPVSPLRHRLELAQLVQALIAREPDLAPRASAYDLADSLAVLLDEMQGEGVPPARLRDLDVSRHAAHWARTRAFVDLVAQFYGPDAAPDTEARQRLAIEHLARKWQHGPPQNPVIVAGSTGSRGATSAFMRAVARLPQGAVVLPGLDTDLPGAVWSRLDDPLSGEDHPQFRHARLAVDLGLSPEDLAPWESISPACPERNRLISLALRPAPVTDQWLTEGARLPPEDLAAACRNLTLIEAATPREEASAIALCLREALDEGRSAALITPDRMLTRQVTSALDRWGIEPDDSAGEPPAQTAPGRFLRHVADLFTNQLTGAALITLLKHPLCHSGSGRGDHLRYTRDLELELLRGGPVFPSPADLTGWAAKRRSDEARLVWATWLAQICDLADETPRALEDHVARHIGFTEALARGALDSEGAGKLWEEAQGRALRDIVDGLIREAGHGGSLQAGEYRDLFHAILRRGEVRNPSSPDPRIRILGTLEARVQSADLVILGGLNDGIWPGLPAPDPWLNRQMRLEAGLLLPERQIGLSAHDFQQAVAGKRVVISRAMRDVESETVPSRWLNRLTNLLGGLGGAGEAALKDMRARGDYWCALAGELDRRPPVAQAPRPAPRPPLSARPRQLSVTRITRLVRDPYAIYAEKILRLAPLPALRQEPDALLKGNILHAIMERFITERPAHEDAAQALARLMTLAHEVLADEAPWPAARTLWHARLARVAARFLDDEAGRMQGAEVLATETRGRLELGTPPFTLTATADRIDRIGPQALAIYDYKSGSGPKPSEQEQFDKQLVLEALIAEAGGFENVAASQVARIAYIGLGLNAKYRPSQPEDLNGIREGLAQLVTAYEKREQGYVARRIPMEILGRSWGDYDHLARFGEWEMSDRARPEEVGE